MKSVYTSFVFAARLMVVLALAACNGTAVVTLTSTAAQDDFLAYRVNLVAVQLQPSGSGKTALKVLPTSTTVDLATLRDLSEVLGAAPVPKGAYTSAIVTVDYSSAQIVYDDGSLNGVALTPVDSNGQALGQVTLTLTLDPSESFSVASNKISRLTLDFKLAASNMVNVTAKTVTVTPLIAASAAAADAKQVRVRGQLASVNSTSLAYLTGIMPFDDSVLGTGQLTITPTSATTYEVNGVASTGASGLAGLPTGTMTVAYGTLTSADTVTTASDGSTTTSTNVSFAASEVLAGSSVQGAGLDRISGIVSARSGNTLAVEDATLIGVGGSDEFISGTTTVNISANTAITVFGQADAEINNPLLISVGSRIDAFGTVANTSSQATILDASAGRVRIGTTTAAGLVTARSTGGVTLGLISLGGRLVSAFDFVGSGASPGQYLIGSGTLDLTNATAQSPVVVTGSTNSFGAATPNFTANSLLDSTTIQAQLAVDWGAGTATPFVTYDGSAIDVDIRNASIGTRHEIQVGPQSIDIVGLSSDPLIVPDPTGDATLFSIGHSMSKTVENFNTYAAFVTQLQTELTGATLATGMTATGIYTTSSFTLSASGITISLNN
jgi:hypothetical protein